MTSIRWKRWSVAAAAFLAAYTLAGFLLVPLLIKSYVPKLGQTILERAAAIGEVRFNPFTLRLEAQDLRLAEINGAPLLGIGKLAVEWQWRSIVRRAWSFADIRITAPSVNLAIAPDGTFNFAELLATIERRPKQVSADTGLPRLIIERFAVEQGTVAVDDRRAGYSNRIAPIEFALTRFSTLPQQDGTHTIGADSERGGKLRWKGEASVNPIRGSGELTLESVSLAELAVYLRSFAQVSVATGTLGATVPYQFSYLEGKFEASVAGARLTMRDLALARANASGSFATLASLDVIDINADLTSRAVTVGEVRASGGRLAARRDATGEIDLANLLVKAATPGVDPDATMTAKKEVLANDWKLELKQLNLDEIAISAVDETLSPPVRLSADRLQMQLQLTAEQAATDLKLTVANAGFSLANLTLASGQQTPFSLARLGFADGEFDLAARRATIGRVYAESGQLVLTRDRKGQLDILNLLPEFRDTEQAVANSRAASGAPWIVVAKRIEVRKFGAEIEDQGSGIKIALRDLAVQLDGASSDLTKSITFNAGLGVREGGQVTAQGSVVPASGVFTADVGVKQLALAPLQPLLSQYVKLSIASGSVSTKGRLTTGAGTAKSPKMRYVGGFDIVGLALKEKDGELFAGWRSVGATKLVASLAPNFLEIPELRVVEANAKLIIENDRSLNALRLLVRPASARAAEALTPTAAQTSARSSGPTPAPNAAQTNDDPFPVRVQRLRIQNAKLDFSDLSLRPQFGAKIYELNGVVNGLSSSPDSRSQIELDGRVDEFGLARIRGEFSPFALRDKTDINVVFKNIDMVSASPYAMKFAGYKVSEGKISLDLQYTLRNGQLEGANQIIIDKLTLGERVDSPDALKLPLELAIAILKDNDGRIDLGLPVSGDMNDPQFSYGAIIWKAIGNVLTKIVTAPFRALGSLFGVSGDKLESIDFEPGSDKLMPPEREKLKQVGQMLSKRSQLKLSVPGQYSEATDSVALKTRALRVEIATRAGVKLGVGEEPGPVDLSDPVVRGALRGLYTERFGAAELEQKKQAAAAAAKPAGKPIPGEPQVPDATAFHRTLHEGLEQHQQLAADALRQLGTQRAEAIVAALEAAGVAPARVMATAPEQVNGEPGKPVSIKLGLTAK